VFFSAQHFAAHNGTSPHVVLAGVLAGKGKEWVTWVADGRWQMSCQVRMSNVKTAHSTMMIQVLKHDGFHGTIVDPTRAAPAAARQFLDMRTRIQAQLTRRVHSNRSNR
jgi:hypothetical protein